MAAGGLLIQKGAVEGVSACFAGPRAASSVVKTVLIPASQRQGRLEPAGEWVSSVVILGMILLTTLFLGCGENPEADPVAASPTAPPSREISPRRLSIRVAQVKIVPEKGKLDQNHLALMDVLEDIEREQGVDVVVTPECFLDGYVSTEKSVRKEDMLRYAIDSETSKYTLAVAEWARRNRVWLIYGCTRKVGEEAYNSALVFNREGTLVGSYDKLHLQSHDHKYTPGRHLDVFDSDFGRFGVMICADRRWPETTLTLAMKGARVVFNPTYGFHNDLNRAMMRTRAYESSIFIAFTHPSQALVTGPDGQIEQDTSDDTQDFAITTIDLSQVPSAGADRHIPDRRPEVYAR